MANANWSNPTLTSSYTNFVSEVKNRDEDLALQFDGTTSTNIPTNAIRWDSSANRWKKWNGSSWAELASTYALTGLSTTGNASVGGTLGVTGAATLSSTLGVTGAVTGSSTVTGTAFIPSAATVPTNGVYLPAANTVGIATNSIARVMVDSSGNVEIKAQGDLRLADSDSSNWVALQAPATVASNVTWTLPSADGSNGQLLSTNGTGTLSWVTGVSDGDKGDITISGSGTVWTVDANAITTTKIADANVTTAKLADGSVTSAKIADGTIVDADINASAAIAGSKISPNFGSQTVATTGTANIGTGVFGDGSAAAPSITNTDDLDTGFLFPAANQIGVSTGGTQRGLFNGPNFTLLGDKGTIGSTGAPTLGVEGGDYPFIYISGRADTNYNGTFDFYKTRGTTSDSIVQANDNLGGFRWYGFDGANSKIAATIFVAIDATPGTNDMPGRLVFSTTPDGASGPSERMRITSAGDVLVGNTAGDPAGSNIAGVALTASGVGAFSRASGTVGQFNRKTDDGTLVEFRQDGTLEGTISVSGTTVSYNGAHLSRWTQLPGGAEREEILRGTVLSNLNEMCEWIEEPTEDVLWQESDKQSARPGEELPNDGLPEGVQVGDVKIPGRPGGPQENEQLNRMKVSDVEGDVNVAGVFQDWDDDDDTYINDFYCAMTGDFIIRIGEGVTVQRGDLLMSAGDGTAKPQDDDIIRSKTVAKVTSTHVVCTYEDGSYCVPCVLMAC